MKDEKYYGIKINNKIPKIDKRNDFDREIEVVFEGNAFIIIRNDKGEIKEKIKLENKEKLTKEKDYEIEFINKKNEIYNLRIKLRTSWIFLFILLFVLGIIIGLIISIPKSNLNNIGEKKYFKYTDIAVLKIAIQKENVEIRNTYDFDVMLKNENQKEEKLERIINLCNSISADGVTKNKIAPGISGSFAIIVSTQNSTVDMKYTISFEDITNEKPTNMKFKIRGEDISYSTLQELEEKLKSDIKRRTTNKIIIDWKWDYEAGNDELDTKEGELLNRYLFKIVVTGEEVIE